jgi:4-amino-4-deoxy-L-arabinose transferase-like glycosyltransferase
MDQLWFSRSFRLAAFWRGAGAGWRCALVRVASLRGEPRPAWLGWLLIGAALLRLGLGVFWTISLPWAGYGTEVERAGYVMEDAFKRDPAAWELAQSGKPLARAFSGYRGSDQYGGLLYASALLYRYGGSSTHQPLLVVVLGAAFSALAVIFTWGASRRMLDGGTAAVAAWGMALYPEAVLLGSSQMREAFTIPLAVAALYGLVRYRQERKNVDLFLLLGALLACLALSPPATILILVTLAAVLAAQDQLRILRRKTLWLVLAGLIFLAGAALWLVWGQIAPEGVTSPLGLADWWLRKSMDYQSFLTEQSSGWIQRVFQNSPPSLHMPLLVVYGVARPFLPAALFAGGAPIWQTIAIWRAAGWTVLLVLLVYSLWIWLRTRPRNAVVGALLLVIWGIILVAALRSGGDQWDNPRYRATLAGVQIMVAAWGYCASRRAGDVWLKRLVSGALLVLAWFVPWYLRRYTPVDWPVVDPFKTLGLGLASAGCYWLWDWPGVKPPSNLRSPTLHAMKTRKYTIWQYLFVGLLSAALLAAPRLADLDQFVTSDEPYWLTLSANFYYALGQRDFAQTFQREHPAVTTLWAGTAGFFVALPGIPRYGQRDDCGRRTRAGFRRPRQRSPRAAGRRAVVCRFGNHNRHHGCPAVCYGTVGLARCTAWGRAGGI